MSQAIKLIALDLDGVLVKYAGKTTLTETSFDTDSFNHVVSLARQHGISISAQRDSYTHAGADFVIDSVIEWNSQLQGYFNINAEFYDSAGLLANQGNYLVLRAFDTESTLRQFVKHLHSEQKTGSVLSLSPTQPMSFPTARSPCIALQTGMDSATLQSTLISQLIMCVLWATS